MLYYRVKPEYDNLRKFNRKKRTWEGIWIGNELYTPKELEKIAKRSIPVETKYFEPVEVKKTEIYFFFGARFSNDTGVTLPF